VDKKILSIHNCILKEWYLFVNLPGIDHGFDILKFRIVGDRAASSCLATFLIPEKD
jgi:hypothetical protein